VLVGAWSNVDPVQVIVLPQRGDRRWSRGGGTHGRHHADVVTHHQLVDQRGGQPVEMVDVIHPEQQTSGWRAGRQRHGGAGQQLGRIVSGGGREIAERAERQLARGLGSARPSDLRPGPAPDVERSVVSLVLPTPASPTSRTPRWMAVPASAERPAPSSVSRPTSGHAVGGVIASGRW